MPHPFLIDLSHPLSPAIHVYPGDPKLRITVLDEALDQAAATAGHVNLSQLHMSLHTGTHLDAPFHFCPDGTTIDQVDLTAACGPACLVDLCHLAPGDEVRPRDLLPHRELIAAAPRVVLHTGWHQRWGASDYFEEHPVISREAAGWLVEQGTLLVGVDTPAVDRAPFPAHRVLLGQGVLILENLSNLDAIPERKFKLVALPLAIVGRDGSPVRAVAVVG